MPWYVKAGLAIKKWWWVVVGLLTALPFLLSRRKNKVDDEKERLRMELIEQARRRQKEREEDAEDDVEAERSLDPDDQLDRVMERVRERRARHDGS